MNDLCRHCGCTEAQVLEDARWLSLEQELRSGRYTCCQIVAWADEQWLAWMEAAEQDGISPEEFLCSTEADGIEAITVHVAKKPQDEQKGRDGGNFLPGRSG